MILATCKTPEEAIRRFKLLKQAVNKPETLKAYIVGNWIESGTDIPVWPRYPGLEVIDIEKSRSLLTVKCDGEITKVYPAIQYDLRKHTCIEIHYDD